MSKKENRSTVQKLSDSTYIYKAVSDYKWKAGYSEDKNTPHLILHQQRMKRDYIIYYIMTCGIRSLWQNLSSTIFHACMKLKVPLEWTSQAIQKQTKPQSWKLSTVTTITGHETTGHSHTGQRATLTITKTSDGCQHTVSYEWSSSKYVTPQISCQWVQSITIMCWQDLIR